MSDRAFVPCSLCHADYVIALARAEAAEARLAEAWEARAHQTNAMLRDVGTLSARYAKKLDIRAIDPAEFERALAKYRTFACIYDDAMAGRTTTSVDSATTLLKEAEQRLKALWAEGRS